MDFSSGDWLSNNATLRNFKICSDSEYIDAVTGKCLRKNACSTTEILIQDKCKTIAAPKIENANFLNVYILLSRDSSSLEDRMRNQHNINLQGAKLLNISTVICEGIVQNKDLSNMLLQDDIPIAMEEFRTDEEVDTYKDTIEYNNITYTCLQLIMAPHGRKFHWIAFTKAPVWRDFAYAFTSYGLIDVVARSHGVNASPSCRINPLRWHKEFQFVSDDYDTQNIQIFIPSANSTHPATSDDIAFRMSPKNKNWKKLINLCISLLLAQLLFLLNGIWSHDFIACKISAVVQHYVWLVSFCWMNVFGIDVSAAFINMSRGIISNDHKSHIVGYAVYAWCVPACVCATALLIGVLTDLPVMYGWENNPTSVCSIYPGLALFLSFGLPIILIVLINFVCFCATIVVYCKTKAQTQAAASTSNAVDVIVCLKISSVMGFTWLFGFLSNIPTLRFLSYVFILINTLQGVTLALSFVCTRGVYQLYRSQVARGETRDINLQLVAPQNDHIRSGNPVVIHDIDGHLD